MKALDTFHPAQDTPETIGDPSLDCSAHYFELQDSVLGVAWYGQGLRLLDVSNARDVRQIGYYRVTGTDPETQPDVARRGTWRGTAATSTCSTWTAGSRCSSSRGGRTPARRADAQRDRAEHRPGSIRAEARRAASRDGAMICPSSAAGSPPP